jgi:YD repeat-containing protein
MIRNPLTLVLSLCLLTILAASPGCYAQHESAGSNSKLAPYVSLVSELTSRARANVYFPNAQSIFRGVQFNFVNVGSGNLTFLRRDIVASGRIPLVLARVYDSSEPGSAEFGPGWGLSLVEAISIKDHVAHLMSESGSDIEFSEARDNVFVLRKDRPSDYLRLHRILPDIIQAELRTGLMKEYRLLGDRYRLTRVIDRNGNDVRLSYRAGMLFKIENANHFIELKRNDQGRVTLAQDDQGRRVRYRYDDKARLIEVDDLGGALWQYSYTKEDKLKTAVDPMRQLNFGVTYDDNGRVRRLQQPSGVTQYRYDTENHSTTVVDRKELVSYYFQNEEGITVRIVNALGEETAINLDNARNVVSLSRSGMLVESMEYDRQHRILLRHSITPTGQTNIRYKYDSTSGALSAIDSEDGTSRAFLYDASGNLISAVMDDGLHQYGYNRFGDLSTYSARGSTFVFAADADGLIASLEEGKHSVANFAYKSGGELSEINFGEGSKARYEYQPSGLREKLVYQDGRKVEYAYDPAGNLVSTKIFDTKGKQVQGQKLLLNESYQVVSRMLFDGTEEIFEYDANGNLTKHIKNGSMARFEYDELNRLIAVVTPAREHLTYTYSSGERSIVEQYEHSGIQVADLRDTGFSFAAATQIIATRPVGAPFGTIRFSESLGTFQLANVNGAEIITPEAGIEQALYKLNLIAHTGSLQHRQNSFNRPFNTHVHARRICNYKLLFFVFG